MVARKRERRGGARAAERDSIADGTALRCAGEAIEAHRECPGDIRWSKCAARVRAALTVART